MSKTTSFVLPIGNKLDSTAVLPIGNTHFVFLGKEQNQLAKKDTSKSESVSEMLKSAIKEYEHGIYDLAEKSGINPAQLYRFVNGERGLTFNAVEKLLPVLGLEIRPKDGTSRARRGK